MSKPALNTVLSNVRTIGDRIVSIEPGKPWPGVYRGSKYSVVSQGREHALLMRYQDLDIEGELPEGIVPALQQVEKSGGDGTGSVRITANQAVLTKVKAENYPHPDEALISEGWIPVYLGTLRGTIDFDWLKNDPSKGELSPPCIWEGLCFNDGERWSVTSNGVLQWRKKFSEGAFRFPSAHSHSELAATYKTFRGTGGRLRINEYGHIWMELPRDKAANNGQLQGSLKKWLQDAKGAGRNRVANLLVERLKATGGGDPQSGNIPLYIGHVSQYDGGHLPSPVITDKQYYLHFSQGDLN